MAKLEAEADQSGVSVEHLAKCILFGDGYQIHELVATLENSAVELRANLSMLRFLGSNAPKDLSPSVLALVTRNARNLSDALDRIEPALRGQERQVVAAAISALRSEIDNTTKAVLEISQQSLPGARC